MANGSLPPMARIHVLVVIGSLRAESSNRQICQRFADLAPPDVDVAVAELHDIPLYHEDIYRDSPPMAVETLKALVTAADAVVFNTPEYNGGVAGVVKNAIDWLSRPAFAGVLVGKVAGVIAASPSRSLPERSATQAHEALAICLAQMIPEFVAVKLAPTALDSGTEEYALLTIALDQLWASIIAACEAQSLAASTPNEGERDV